jgi:hypothetical protein
LFSKKGSGPLTVGSILGDEEFLGFLFCAKMGFSEIKIKKESVEIFNINLWMFVIVDFKI